ncbi:MAG: benzoate/H(+) symporter BenE family transporter [Acidobacteria bacterium]|nr:benzoate/H(+) symporter BenE family transporter [Acidobacteriota bacterium]
MAWVEPGYNVWESAKIALKNINPAAVGTGFVAAIFSIAGPGLIVMNAAQQGKLAPELATSWLFILELTGGLYSIYFALRYRLPVVIAYSIPGVILIGKSLTHLSFGEAVGAYYVVAVVVGLLSISGLVKKAVSYLPLPVMLGMIAGVMMSFGVSLIDASKAQPLLIAPPVAIFFILMVFRNFSRKFPPILGAVLVGGFLVTFLDMANWDTLRFSLARPVLYMTPEFTAAGFFELAIPLSVLAIGVQNIQAVGVLMAEGYKNLPVNSIFIFPTIGTLQNALFGGHPSVTAGPSTAICSSPAAGEDKSLRFIAVIVDGMFWLAFALFAGLVIAAADVVPKELTAMLAGLAMFGVLIHAFSGAFNGQFRSGALVSFLVAVSNITIFNIGAPFWALVLGLLFSLLLEPGDFYKLHVQKEKELEMMDAAMAEGSAGE